MQGALPLDPTKGSSTLWTPFRAIELVTLSNFFRVFIRKKIRRSDRIHPPVRVPFFIYSTHFRYCPDSISSEKKYRQLS